MMSSSDGEDQVEQACQGLKASIANFLRKCDQKHQNRQGSHKNSRSNSSSSSSSSSSDATITRLVDHSCFWLRQLAYKRQSLELGIQSLVQHVREITSSIPQQLQQLSKVDNLDAWLSSWLQHIFDQYLRLRDGIVLLTSGECRHEGDITRSKSTRFKSKLKSTSYRPDGYTVLYRGEHYCGYSWDEGMDPDVGIQHRLQTALWNYYYYNNSESHATTATNKKKKKTAEQLWEQYILEKAPMYSLVLDQHEVQMERLQRELDAFRQSLEQDLNRMMRLLPNNATTSSSFTKTTKNSNTIRVQWVAHDKMERLQVVTMGKTSNTMVIERHGNQFQIRDERGVLPNHMTRDEWKEIMKFTLTSPPVYDDDDDEDIGKPTNSTKKRKATNDVSPGPENKRRNPNDSNQEPTITTTTASGLLVRAKIQTECVKNEDDNTASVADIKRQLGVNVEQLEEGRDVLEAEEQLALQEAQTIDQHYELEQEESDLHDDIKHHKRLVEYLQSTKLPQIHTKASQQMWKGEQLVEAWDIREALRQSNMTIGNNWLALHSLHLERQDKTKASSHATNNPPLDQALEAFQQALHWVDEQESSLPIMTQWFQKRLPSNSRTREEDDLDPTQLQITLWLYRGRAYTNLGIVLFRLWQEKSNVIKGSTTLRKSDAKVSLLRRSTEALEHAMQNVDKLLHEPQLNRADRVSGNQLKSLTTRWLGTVSWHQGQWPKAVSVMLEQGCDAVWIGDSSGTTTSTSPLHVQLSKLVHDDEESKRNEVNMYDELEWGAECYYNCISLVDLAGSALENMAMVSSRNKEVDSKANELLSWTKRALRQAAGVSKTIAALLTLQIRAPKSPTTATTSFLEDYDIKQPGELEKAQQEMVEWWEEARRAGSKPLALPHKLSSKQLPRNDLLGDGPAGPCNLNLPRQRFIVQHGDGEPWRKHRRRQKQQRGGGESNSRSFRCGTDNDDDYLPTTPSFAPSQRKVRKWGDQLLPQVEVEPGKFLPKVVYPAVAPEMPPEIKRIILANQGANQTRFALYSANERANQKC